MTFQTTLVLFVISALCLAVSLYFSRKAEPMTWKAYVPWAPIQFLSLLFIFVFGGHLVGEWLGTPFIGTRSPVRGL